MSQTCHGHVRAKAAEYWMKRNKPEKALQHWRALLITDISYGSKIFPVLTKVAENPESLYLIKPLAIAPPPWWGQFYKYLAEKTIKIDALIAVTSMRDLSEVKLSGDERRYLVRRLLKEQIWSGAYLVCINGLDSEQRKYLGNIYNGGFELEPTNEGFDWVFPRVRGVEFNRQETYSLVGIKALHLTFSGQEIRFNHLRQYLFLPAGDQEFQVGIRMNQLSSRGGLKWVVRCSGDVSRVLGESNRILGTSGWYKLRFHFTVPANDTACESQLLQLESTGKNNYDHKLEGEIWFDSLAIKTLYK